MAAAMQERGPDGSGAWSSGRVALAHRRLSIIDLSPHGAQPMVDPHLGVAAVFNGCIYNYPELREELLREGFSFFSTSDTEVLIKAWKAWGDGFVDRLYGMFAFCLVDTVTGRALLGRDRLGIKPLYLADTPEGLRFGSTLPGLLAGGGIDTSLDPVALHHYFMWHAVVPPPLTVLRGVRKLAPATLLAIEPDGRRTETVYWQAPFDRDEEHAAWSATDWEEALLEALRRAVARRMVSDVPVGVLLSGGLDSSLIVALLAEQGQKDLTTFSIGFEDVGGRSGDEFEYSRPVAQEYGTDPREIHIATERMLPELPGAIHAMSEPMTSHDAVAFYLLSEEVAKDIKVVQSGQGADEILAGYSWYQEIHAGSGDGPDRYRSAFFDRSVEELRALLGDAFAPDGEVAFDFVRRHFARPGAPSPVDQALRIDTEIMLVDD